MSASIPDTACLGPHAFLPKEAPKYETGVQTILGCAVAQVVLAFCLRALLVRRNAKRDQEEGETSTHGVEGEMENIDDVTDFENRRFRYAM